MMSDVSDVSDVIENHGRSDVCDVSGVVRCGNSEVSQLNFL